MVFPAEALLAAPIWQSYCHYVARRFGFPPVVAQVLQSVVQPLQETKRLPAMHAFAWCHRSDLAALGFLYQDWDVWDGVSGRKYHEILKVNGN